MRHRHSLLYWLGLFWFLRRAMRSKMFGRRYGGPFGRGHHHRGFHSL
jgi:hypothetical protein